MHVALFGAAFDPPHLGHAQVAEGLLELGLVDEVRYLPVNNHPFHKTMSAVEHRLAMLKLLLSHSQQSFSLGHHITIDDYELHKNDLNYSYDTLRFFRQQNPEHTFSWVIGADNIESFSKWHFYQELLREFKVYVYPRPGFVMKALLPGMEALTGVTEVNISSTQIREHIQQGHSIAQLVPQAVAQYIQTHRLYLCS